MSLLLAKPASLLAHVTKDHEEQFCLAGHEGFYFCIMTASMKAALKYKDMSAMRRLIVHGLAYYSWLLDKAIDDAFRTGIFYYDWLARPLPGLELRGNHNSALKWLHVYPPLYVVQATLVM